MPFVSRAARLAYDFRRRILQKHAKLTIPLEEYLDLLERANADGRSVAKTVSKLAQAQLGTSAYVPGEVLNSVRDLSRQLRAIGTHTNQIAKACNLHAKRHSSPEAFAMPDLSPETTPATGHDRADRTEEDSSAFMIIKSTSRKDRSFGQLYDYVNREGKSDTPVLFWNLIGCESSDRDGVVGEFLDNADHLPERANGNVLYHEIVSLKRTSEHDLETLTQALYELANHYLERRAPDCLAFGRIHIETGHVHCHLIISANVMQGDRHSLSKFQFAAIQTACERYLKAEYPQLIQQFRYGQNRQHQAQKFSSGEFQMQRRLSRGPTSTEKPLSDKARVTAHLAAIFAEEITHTTKPLVERLREAGFALYQNKCGHPGVIKGKKKYRFYRMGLLESFQRVTAEEAAFSARKAELIGHASRTAPAREAMERDEDFAPGFPGSS